MYNEQIKQILKSTYEVSAHTLDIGSSAVRGEKLYFYSLDKACESEIDTIKKMLDSQFSSKGTGSMNELRQLFPGDRWHLPQCACYTESEGFWYLTFHPVKGVRYHKTYGKHIAATLMIQDIPIVKLSEESKETLFGYWDETFYNRNRNGGEAQAVTKGLNYRVNRNLLHNTRFRTFTSEFFLAIVETERKYILKDIARTVREWGYYLPSISPEDTFACHTPAEISALVVPNADRLSINFNRVDMNVGYVIKMLSPFIDKRDWPELVKFTPELTRKCISSKNLFDGMNSSESIEEFLVNYYRFSRAFSEKDISGFIGDYVHMSLACNSPIRLGVSLKRLKKAHDVLSQQTREREYSEAERDVPLTAVLSRFDDLEKTLDRLFPLEFQRMHTTEQLMREGDFQHNCVFSRRNLIERDRVAIFHWNFDNTSHTVQFAMDNCGKYRVDEIKARYNQECSVSATKRIGEILSRVNSAP